MLFRSCPDCGGRGTIINDPCPDCGGQGRKRVTRKLEVKVPAGVDTGSRLRMSGEGEAGEQGGPKGDLYIYINVRSHPIFTRDDGDIYMEQEINFAEAALGADIQVPTLEGNVTLTIPAGVQNGAKFRMKGKGVKSVRGYGKGDQYVTVKVVTPKNLTAEQKDLFKQLAATLAPAKSSASAKSETRSMGADTFADDKKKDDSSAKNEKGKEKGFFGKIKDVVEDLWDDDNN